jgi:hypothetical protein
VLYKKGAGPTAGAEGAAPEAGAASSSKPDDDVIEGEFEVKK